MVKLQRMNRPCEPNYPGIHEFIKELGKRESQLEDVGIIPVQCLFGYSISSLIHFTISDTFHINPQLHLILSEMEEAIVSLNQHSVMEPKVIGFTLYPVSKGAFDSMGKTFFKKNKSLVNSQYTNSRQVS